MKNALMNTYGATTVITKGNGCHLYDENGKEYIDFTSGIGVNSLGYNDPTWKESVTNQLNTLQHCSNLFLNPTTVELSNKFTALANMSKVFFSNSGAEANECAIKLARKYSFDKYGKDRNKVLTLKQSFHGRTMLTLKATGQPEKFHKYFFPFPEGFDYVEANNTEAFKAALSDDVCAIMMEAIQGEGGVHPLTKDFVQEVVKICNEKDILVIFDEVQCGIARTGKLFGFNNFDVNPDIVTCAKGLAAGLPIGAILCNDKLKDVFNPGDHGSTFGGNPVSCSSALVVLDKICNEETYAKVNEKGQLVRDMINKANLSNVVEIRGMGLMIGIEIKGNSADIRKKAEENGLLVLTAGPHVVRLLPPIVIDSKDIENGINILIDLLK